MKFTVKLFLVVLTFVCSFGLFYTPNANAGDNGKTEVVYMDGQWYQITYSPDGGIVEIKIMTND